VLFRSVYDPNGNILGVMGVARDITERKNEEKILAVHLKLFEYAIDHSTEELLQKFLDEAEILTDSKIGFYHFVEDDQESISLQTWSTNTLNNMCKGSGEATRHYPISKAGVWVDCVKERKAVIHNDYNSLAHKKGLPKGHAPIKRELVVPVIRGNKIVAILGVGNKEKNYDHNDTHIIQRMADAAWETVVRKQAEEKLIESEEKYRTMIETSNDMIWLLDLKGNFTFINKHAEKATGFLLEKFKGKSFVPLVLKDEEAFLTEVFTRVIGGETVAYEMNLKTEFDTVLILSANTAPLYSENKVIGALSFARDITEQKNAEANLIESESRFKALHNASFGGIAIHDAGIIKECNQGLSNMTGYSIEELIEMNGLLLISEDYREKVMNNIESHYEKPYESIGLRKNGERYAIRLEGRKIPYKGKELRVVEFRDISEQKKSEKALMESEERFTLSMRASKDGLFDWNLITNEIFYSENWKKMLGYENHELPNNIATWQKLTDIKGKEKSLKKMDWAINNSIPRYEEEFKMKHKDGHWVDIMSRAEFVYNEKKEAIRVVGTHVDITKQRKYEHNLKNAVHKATESDRLKSAFLATMSHELRTPLNAIIGFSEVIKDDYSIDEIKSFNEHIHSSGKHLLSIVEDLFDITLIETGEIKLKTTKENISDLLSNVNQIIKAEQLTLEKRHIDLKIKIAKDCKNLSIVTDTAKLKQVLINLLKNALKFTHKGFVEFGCKIISQQNTKLLEFYVQDSGIGISKDKHEIIFNLFRQLEDSHTRIYGGTGIGLSITKKLVEILGGTILINSEEGKGSTFYFTLPLNLIEKTSIKEDDLVKIRDIHSVDSNTEITEQKTVLVVEDIQASFDLIKILLRDQHFKLLWAKNGLEAIDIFKKNGNIDLILMDINMPEMNGYEATKAIKLLNPKIPIIAQTAYAISGDKEKALNVGCDDYISKPIKRVELLEKIGKILK